VEARDIVHTGGMGLQFPELPACDFSAKLDEFGEHVLTAVRDGGVTASVIVGDESDGYGTATESLRQWALQVETKLASPLPEVSPFELCYLNDRQTSKGIACPTS